MVMTLQSRFSYLLSSILLVTLLPSAFSNPCLGPTVSPKIYTSSEGPLATSTVFIVEFSLSCKNEVTENINLYATINGKTLPAVRSKGGLYQVSLVEEHANAPKGVYDVGIYDEDGYASLRKAQRTENVEEAAPAAVQPLVGFQINHGGVWKGAPVQSEIIAFITAVLLWYMAYSAKNKLQESV
jgi:translocon-associated protein subunit delta